MRVLYLNNDGGGFADYVEIQAGTTVQKFFAERVPHGKAQDYLIRVNRQPAAADQVLQENDRVSLTPTKIEGAGVSQSLRRRKRTSFRRIGWQKSAPR